MAVSEALSPEPPKRVTVEPPIAFSVSPFPEPPKSVMLEPLMEVSEA